MHDASRSEFRPASTTRGIEGVSIFAVVFLLLLCCYSCWVSKAGDSALNHFDQAMGMEKQR